MSDTNRIADEVPQGWVETTLGDVVLPTRPKRAPQDFPQLPFIGMEHVEAHTMRLLGTVPAHTMNSAAVHFQPKDVLYGRLRPYLNKVYKPDFEGLCSAEFIVFPESPVVNADFLSYLLNSRTFVSFSSHLNEGDRPRVDFSQISSYPVLLPPLDEQVRIVAEIEQQFSVIDAGIASLKRAQANLKRYRASVLQAACTGKLVPTEAELRSALPSSPLSASDAALPSPPLPPSPAPLGEGGVMRVGLSAVTPEVVRSVEGAGEFVLGGASEEIVRRARELRGTATTAEALLWELLRDRRLDGLKFRRQHPLGKFIADFYCDTAKLIIELDGGIHTEPAQQERDRERERILELNRYHILRFTNEQVLNKTETVLQTIHQAATRATTPTRPLTRPTLTPPAPLSRFAGRGGGQHVSTDGVENRITPPSPSEAGEGGRGGEGKSASEKRLGGEGKTAPADESRGNEAHPYEPADQLLQRILTERRARWEADQLARLRAQGKEPKDDKWKAKYEEPAAPDTSGLPDLPHNWTWTTVEQSIKIIDYRGRTPPYAEAGIPHLRSSNVKNGKVVWTDMRYVTPDTYDAYMTRGIPQDGDVLFTTEAPLGEVAPVPTNTAFSLAQRLVVLRPKEGVFNQHFLMYQIMSREFQSAIGLRGTGSTVEGVSSRNFKTTPLRLPPLAEQERIVAEVERRLSVAEHMEAALAANLKRAERLKQSILRDAFAGRLVPQDPTDEPASVLLDRIRAERAQATAIAPKARASTRRPRPDTAQEIPDGRPDQDDPAGKAVSPGLSGRKRNAAQAAPVQPDLFS